MSNYKRYYTENYSYIFITIVTFNRQNILFDNINILRSAFNQAKSKYSFEIIAICIMNNHLHMIIKEDELKNYSKIISSIKKYFSYNFNAKPDKMVLPQSMQKRKEAGVWQRRFYDHIIRNEEDLYKHIDYIHYNCYKHYGIVPKDWQYSTFSKFVKNGLYDENWCNYDDKYNILNLEIE